MLPESAEFDQNRANCRQHPGRSLLPGTAIFPQFVALLSFSVSASSFARPAAGPCDRLLLDRDVAILRRQLEDLVLLHLHARWQQRDQRTNLESNEESGRCENMA